VGRGSAHLTVSRLGYEGERDHSAADIRVLNARLEPPVFEWVVARRRDCRRRQSARRQSRVVDAAELQANRDTVPLLNRNRDAGKAVTQVQSGATLRRSMANGGEATLAVFGLARDLKNPNHDHLHRSRARRLWCARLGHGALPLGSLQHRLTAGFDFQHQHDNRKNFNYLNTPGDSSNPTACERSISSSRSRRSARSRKACSSCRPARR